MKTNKELTEKYSYIVSDPLKVERVDNVNYKPHPFMIGTEHVAYASDKNRGILDESVTNKIGCARQDTEHGPKCRRPYDEHTSDKALFLTLAQDCTQREVKAALLAIKEELELDKIDGVAFIKSKYNWNQPLT